MSNANLTIASKTLQGIKSNPALLEEFDVALTKFRHRLGGSLDDATFTYVVNALLNQRITDGTNRFSAATGVTRLPAGFQILAAVEVDAVR